MATEMESEDVRMARNRLLSNYSELMAKLEALDRQLDEIKDKAEFYRDIAENLGIIDMENKFVRIELMKITGW